MPKFKVTQISQFILLATSFIIPVLFLPLNSISLEPTKNFILLFVAILLSLFILIQKIKKNSFFVTKNLLWLSAGGVLLSSLLSSIFSNNPLISFFGKQINMTSFLSIVLLFTLSYIVSVFFADGLQKTRLFLAIHFSVLIGVLIHLLNIFVPFLPNLNFFLTPTANTIGKWYELGLFGLFGMLSSILVLQFFKHVKLFTIIGWVGFSLSTLLVLIVNTPLVWFIGAIFALVYVVLNAVLQHDVMIQNKVSYPALGVLILSVVFLLIGSQVGVLTNNFLGIQFEEAKPTITSTYQVTKEVLQKRPIFGSGINRFETAWLQYKPVSVNVSNYWDTDFKNGFSTLFSIPVTQGIVGILAWIFFVCMSLYYSFKLLFIKLKQKSDLFINLYSVLGFLFSLVVFTVYVPSVVFIGMLFIFFGLFVSNLNSAGLIVYREIKIEKSPRISFLYILSLVLLLIACIYGAYIIISQYTSRIIFDRASVEYSQNGNIQALENSLVKAQFIYSSDFYLRSLAEVGMLKIDTLLNDKNISQEQAINSFRSILQNTVNYSQSAIAYDNLSYINRMSLVTIYKNLASLQVPGAKDEALKLLDDTANITPNNPSISLEKARVYATVKEYDQAITEIKNAIQLKPNYVDAVFLLSQIQVEQGEIDQAILSIQAAINVNPSDANLFFQLGLLTYNQQKYNDAVTSFENAVMRSPYFGNAKYFLGLSYYKNGRTNDALLQFEDLAQLYPSNSEISLILSNLKAGKEPLDGAQPPTDIAPEQREELPVDSESQTSDQEIQ